MKQKLLIITFFAFIIMGACRMYSSQNEEVQPEKTKVSVKVDFTKTLQDWDGFGVNYVELAQSTDPVNDPQEYGGFSRLSEEKRQEIIDLIFGEDGLKPNIIKMFFDPFHQKEPGAKFDHESTTAWMRYFAHQGIAKTEERNGANIEIITTLYGPPAWATQQKFLRGRDLDPTQYENLAKYMIDWCRYLADEENLPVKYLSLHNEGDSPNRWPLDGSTGNIGTGHDYNAFWRPWQVAYFLEFMPPMIKASGLNIGLTPGECTTWWHMATHWYHWAIHDNDNAMKNMALITSHGFGAGDRINSQASDLLRLERPELHAWTTSMTWGGKAGMKDFMFMDYIRRNIYEAKVNAVIPWAALQTLTWVGGDPNPGTAIFVSENGNYEVKPQYYYYKQLSPFGQRGMKVASVESEENSNIELMAFASNETTNPDAFLVLNLGDEDKEVTIDVLGNADTYKCIRTSNSEKFQSVGDVKLTEGSLTYNAPQGSVTTFIALN
ncbi:hypothetical protein [uncultured Draconibacterium sp.]|uniref:hypothetical protein n=1 Tax=uncultured Draconibacterium sp. TaxID=1573823 RepID=UPI0029C91B0F|nr:hypothetical protein [uncultured Draconibacterium sp.]